SGNANASGSSDLTVEIGSGSSTINVSGDISVRGVQTSNVLAIGASDGFGGIAVSGMTANATATRIDVKATVNGGTLQGRDVRVEAVSILHVRGEASHEDGGGITIGKTDSFATVDQ